MQPQPIGGADGAQRNAAHAPAGGADPHIHPAQGEPALHPNDGQQPALDARNAPNMAQFPLDLDAYHELQELLGLPRGVGTAHEEISRSAPGQVAATYAAGSILAVAGHRLSTGAIPTHNDLLIRLGVGAVGWGLTRLVVGAPSLSSPYTTAHGDQTRAVTGLLRRLIEGLPQEEHTDVRLGLVLALGRSPEFRASLSALVTAENPQAAREAALQIVANPHTLQNFGMFSITPTHVPLFDRQECVERRVAQTADMALDGREPLAVAHEHIILSPAWLPWMSEVGRYRFGDALLDASQHPGNGCLSRDRMDDLLDEAIRSAR